MKIASRTASQDFISVMGKSLYLANIRRKISQTNSLIGILLVLPLVVLILGLILYPFALSIYLSFTNKMVGRPASFVGLGNYVYLIGNYVFRRSVLNTLIYAMSAVGLKFVVGFAIALSLNKDIKGRSLFSGIFLLPWIIPGVVSCLVWYWMFNDIHGIINVILLKTGVIKEGIGWLGQPKTAMFTVIFVNFWRGVSFFTINFLAGLQTVSPTLYDAAAVDGASQWAKLWYITIPRMKSIITIVCTVSLIWTFSDFQTVYLLTRGGPGSSTEVFATLTYQIAIGSLQIGRGVAVSLFTFPILLIAILLITRSIEAE